MDDNVDELYNSEQEDSETLKENARIKSALYYSIGRMCEMESEKNNVSFSKEYLASLTELVFSQGELIANDLEAFCRHGKRTVINMDDVKLIARKNEKLSEILEAYSKKISDEQKSKVKGRKRKAEHVIIDD